MSLPLSPLKSFAPDLFFDDTFQLPEWGFFHNDSFDDLLNLETRNLETRSITPDEFLSKEEVETFFQAIDGRACVVSKSLQANEHSSAGLKVKKGRWSRKEAESLVSYVEGCKTATSSRINWEKIAMVFHRHQDECLLKYTELTNPKQPIQEEISCQKKRTLTRSDVALCKQLIQNDKIVKEDGTLDVLKLSRQINRAVSSLRYNLYHQSNSLFDSDSFFAPYIQRYHELHPS